MFEYQLKVSNKRKTIALKVSKNNVIVYAPYNVNKEYLDSWLFTKRAWVQRQQSLQVTLEGDQKPLSEQKIKIFGHKYQLIFDTQLDDDYFLDHDNMRLTIKYDANDNLFQKRERLISSMENELNCYITKLVQKYSKEMEVCVNNIKVKEYKSRWGSCNNQNALTFNCLLMSAPLEMIKYVVIHELAHCIEMSHSKHFWKIVEHFCPTYKVALKWFKKNGSSLFIEK